MQHLVEIVIMLLGSAALGYLLRFIRDRSVRADLKAAREQNDRFKTQLIEADGEKSALTANARQAQAEAERLRGLLVGAEERIAGSQQAFAPVADEIAALRRRQEAAEAEMADLRRALRALRLPPPERPGDEAMAPALSPVELAGVAASLAPAVAAAVAAHLPQPALVALEGGARTASTPAPSPASVAPIPPPPVPPAPPQPPPPPAPPQEAGDDLGVLSGLDPKLAALLKAAGVKTWKSIAEKSVDDLRAMLDAAGASGVDASTWPEQARLAAGGHWAQLRALQRGR